MDWDIGKLKKKNAWGSEEYFKNNFCEQSSSKDMKACIHICKFQRRTSHFCVSKGLVNDVEMYAHLNRIKFYYQENNNRPLYVNIF